MRPVETASRVAWSKGAAAEPVGCRVHETAEQARADRLAIMLAILCVLHAFDLAFTQTQLSRPNFAESNSLARLATSLAPENGGGSGYRVAAFKCALFGVGLLLLWAMRRRWQAECGAWFLLGVSAALMAWWICYLTELETCLCDPARLGELDVY